MPGVAEPITGAPGTVIAPTMATATENQLVLPESGDGGGVISVAVAVMVYPGLVSAAVVENTNGMLHPAAGSGPTSIVPTKARPPFAASVGRF